MLKVHVDTQHARDNDYDTQYAKKLVRLYRIRTRDQPSYPVLDNTLIFFYNQLDNKYQIGNFNLLIYRALYTVQ